MNLICQLPLVPAQSKQYRWIVKMLFHPWVAAAAIGLLTLGLVLGIRAKGGLQWAELLFYDYEMRSGQEQQKGGTAPRIVICGLEEADLRRFGHPIDDAKLAELIDIIAAAAPYAIGLDIYRDLKEPRSGELYPKLESSLRRHENLIAIEKMWSEDVIPPPPALEGTARVAPNNLPDDHWLDHIFRRAVIFFEPANEDPRESFAFALTNLYLTTAGTELSFEETEDGIPLLKLGSALLPRLKSDSGGYVDANLVGYEILIDYREPSNFEHVSFGDILDGKIDPARLKNKIVLIGTTTPSVKDSNPTPISKTNGMRGIDQHALVIAQLLKIADGKVTPILGWPEPIEIAWITLWTLLGGVAGFICRSPWKFVPVVGVLSAAIIYSGDLVFKQNLWIPVAAPLIGELVAATLVVSYSAFIERAERATMHHLFSRHVSKSVAETLWKERDSFLHGGRIQPRRLLATILFTDLRGFSSTSEKMSPEKLMEWINEYMSGIAKHVDLHGGFVSAYIGDAIMAAFGVPVPRKTEEEHNQDAINAVRCALAMRKDLAQLNQEWKERGLPATAMRVGIFTGHLVAGSVGSSDRLEFTVLGDSVNTAARLESAGKDVNPDPDEICTILIGETTFLRLGDLFETKYIGSIALKGKAEPVVVYSVVGEIIK